jgi:spore coat protein U-like protein
MGITSATWHRAFRLIAGAIVLAFAASAAAAPKCNGGGNPAQVTATAMSFGNYNAASPGATTANSTITVSCVDASRELPAITVALSTGGSGTYAPRSMSSGANTLDYNIYTSAAFTSVWGNGTGGTVTITDNPTVNSVSFTAYGQVPAGQYVTPGSYTDTITVTVTY